MSKGRRARTSGGTLAFYLDNLERAVAQYERLMLGAALGQRPAPPAQAARGVA